VKGKIHPGKSPILGAYDHPIKAPADVPKQALLLWLYGIPLAPAVGNHRSELRKYSSTKKCSLLGWLLRRV